MRLKKKRGEFRPTSYYPGSDEKIAIMRERYLNRLPLFHPDDQQIPLDYSALPIYDPIPGNRPDKILANYKKHLTFLRET